MCKTFQYRSFISKIIVFKERISYKLVDKIFDTPEIVDALHRDPASSLPDSTRTRRNSLKYLPGEVELLPILLKNSLMFLLSIYLLFAIIVDLIGRRRAGQR